MELEEEKIARKQVKNENDALILDLERFGRIAIDDRLSRFLLKCSILCSLNCMVDHLRTETPRENPELLTLKDSVVCSYESTYWIAWAS
jgi:hypothetical protein